MPKQTGEPPFPSSFYIYLFIWQRPSKHYWIYASYSMKTNTLLQMNIGQLNLKFKTFLQFWMLQLIHFSRILQVLSTSFRSSLSLYLASLMFKQTFRSHELGSPELGNGFKTWFWSQAKCPIIDNVPQTNPTKQIRITYPLLGYVTNSFTCNHDSSGWECTHKSFRSASCPFRTEQNLFLRAHVLMTDTKLANVLSVASADFHHPQAWGTCALHNAYG